MSRRRRALGLWLAGAAPVLSASALAGHVLPWRLDDRLRCAAAFEATVGPAGCEEDVIARATAPGQAAPASVEVGRDPWGRPFHVLNPERWGGQTFALSVPLTVSAGRDGVLAGPPWTGDVVVPPPHAVHLVRSLPTFAALDALLVYLALTTAWALGGQRERSLGQRIAVLLAMPLPAALFVDGTLDDGRHALRLQLPATLLGGQLAPFLSVHAALVVAGVALHLTAAHRTRTAEAE